MKRLRHPIRSIREPFGKAGLTIAILALVLAMVGGAWAAGALTAKQKKEVKAIAKSFAGKPGAPGAPGTAGTNGTNGKDGANGKDGKSVAVGAATAGECSTGSPKAGVTVEVEGSGVKKVACNGKEGPEGSPWTAGGTLPSGQTETGAWSVTIPLKDVAVDFATEEVTKTAAPVFAPISFPIPLAVEISNTHIDEPETENCPGNAEEPLADTGHLCIYVAQNMGVTLATVLHPGKSFFGGAAGKTGALIFAGGEAGKVAWGTWAVTAP